MTYAVARWCTHAAASGWCSRTAQTTFWSCAHSVAAATTPPESSRVEADVRAATFPPPDADDLGDAASAGLLRTALRIGFRSTAGPFRSLANIAVEPRAYQFVPL